MSKKPGKYSAEALQEQATGRYETCPNCNGRGKIGKVTCIACDGVGRRRT